MKDKESEWTMVTCILAKYAAYANVEENKTGGYGVVKICFEELTEFCKKFVYSLNRKGSLVLFKFIFYFKINYVS